MLPTPDPMSRQQFGGDEMLLNEIHAYGRAVRDLKGKANVRTAEAEDDAGETPAKTKAVAKRQGK